MNEILSLTGNKTSKEILKDYIQKLESECHGKQHSTETVRFLIEEKDFTVADMVRYAQTLSASSTAEGVDRVTQGKEQEPEHGSQPQEHKPLWQERVQQKPLTRRAEVGEATVSTEVKTLPETREYMKALATAQGLHTQQLIEKLMVDAINKNQNLVKQGEEYLERFNGNIAAARRYAVNQKLSHLESLETPVFTPSL